MQKFTQKYTLVHTIKSLPDGYEFSMEDWPLHITMADVFAIKGNPQDLLKLLNEKLSNYGTVKSKVIGEDWFGDKKTVHVMLINKSYELQSLHETIIHGLEHFDVTFNTPQFIYEGFIPHSTVKDNEQLHEGYEVNLNSITLIDMFPDKNPFRRRVLGTIRFLR